MSDNTAKEDKERRALDKRKYLALSRRCKEIEQVSVRLFIRHKATGISYKSATVDLKHLMTFPLMLEISPHQLTISLSGKPEDSWSPSPSTENNTTDEEGEAVIYPNFLSS